MPDFFNDGLNEHISVLKLTQFHLRSEFDKMLDVWVQAIRLGNKLIFFGNGGSASDAQHLATEFTVRYNNDRPAIAAIALTTDTSALTAIGNDYGFDYIFSRQIEAIGQRGDVAVGFSTSGTSPNVINAFKEAKKKGMKLTGFTGNDGGDMVGLVNSLLIIPSTTTARIQEMHITLGHQLCSGVEITLGLVKD